jgi:hypothetical protein
MSMPAGPRVVQCGAERGIGRDHDDRSPGRAYTTDEITSSTVTRAAPARIIHQAVGFNHRIAAIWASLGQT